jgi:CheY-like chemotaxis protein
MENKKILVIDDDMTALDIVDFLFEDEGYEVARRADGITALEFLENELPDIMLVDLMMPKMNGKDCIMQARNKGINIPIIAFTAIDDPEVHQEAIDAGANLVLTKPCKPNKLLETINKFIEA